MDVVRTEKKRSLKKLKTAIAAAAGLVAIVILAYGTSAFSTKSYNRNGLLIAEVMHGDMQVKVFGNGVLVPKEVRWVATNVSGRVNRILVKPGAYVEKGQVLVELENPELVQQSEEVSWEVEASRAEHTALEVSLESDILNQQSRIKTVEIDLESAKLKFDAEKTLLEAGHGGISKLDHKTSELNVRQLKNDLQVETLRLSRLEKNRDAQINASRARLKKLENSLMRAQSNVTSLNVVAQATGVVQDVSVELGQRLSIGNNLVKIADQSNLIAEIKIPERLINEVAVGQAAIVDTRQNEVMGKVTRIDPAVVNGAVLVEVEFVDALPKEARPDLRISGDILIADIQNTLYVKRPVLAQSEQDSVVYKLDKSQSYASKIKVSYGQGSSDQIEILAGLESGDRVILSDHSSWEHIEKIRIN